MQKLVFLALAGAAGTLARYGFGGLTQRLIGETFPVGTLVVNATGCFLVGLFWSYAEQRLSVNSEIRTIVLIGFMGAFTTFSSYAFESVQLLRDGQWLDAGVNIAAQNGLGIVMVFAGLFVGQLL